MDKISDMVCIGTNCCFAGGERLLEVLEEEESVLVGCELSGIRCIGKKCVDG